MWFIHKCVQQQFIRLDGVFFFIDLYTLYFHNIFRFQLPHFHWNYFEIPFKIRTESNEMTWRRIWKKPKAWKLLMNHSKWHKIHFHLTKSVFLFNSQLKWILLLLFLSWWHSYRFQSGGSMMLWLNVVSKWNHLLNNHFGNHWH